MMKVTILSFLKKHILIITLCTLEAIIGNPGNLLWHVVDRYIPNTLTGTWYFHTLYSVQSIGVG